MTRRYINNDILKVIFTIMKEMEEIENAILKLYRKIKNRVNMTSSTRHSENTIYFFDDRYSRVHYHIFIYHKNGNEKGVKFDYFTFDKIFLDEYTKDTLYKYKKYKRKDFKEWLQTEFYKTIREVCLSNRSVATKFE